MGGSRKFFVYDELSEMLYRNCIRYVRDTIYVTQDYYEFFTRFTMRNEVLVTIDPHEYGMDSQIGLTMRGLAYDKDKQVTVIVTTKSI